MRPMLLSLALPALGCTSNPVEGTQHRMTRTVDDSRISSRRKVEIELLALDLETCGRCTRTERNLEEALRTAASRLHERDIAVEVAKHVIGSEAEAKRLRFTSSPTIRVDGRDIALDLRESPCEDCGELCGCEGGVSCRVWVWKGQEHLEAPTEMIVEAILGASASPPARDASGPYRMPENLRAFFDARARKETVASKPGGTRVSCCGPATQSECCGTNP